MEQNNHILKWAHLYLLISKPHHYSLFFHIIYNHLVTVQNKYLVYTFMQHQVSAPLHLNPKILSFISQPGCDMCRLLVLIKSSQKDYFTLNTKINLSLRHCKGFLSPSLYNRYTMLEKIVFLLSCWSQLSKLFIHNISTTIAN